MLYLLFLDRLEDLDYAFLVVDDVDTLKHFTVFASTNFPNNFVVVLIPVKKGSFSTCRRSATRNRAEHAYPQSMDRFS